MSQSPCDAPQSGKDATAARRQLVVLCLSSAGWAFSFGLGAPLASLWLHDAGLSAKFVGLNTSFYYFGIALAAPVIPWLMARSNRGCLVAGMVADAVTTALFPWTDSLWGWFLLRLVGGVASAMSLIPMETRVNHNAPPKRRAQDFGVYAFSVALGVGLGILAGLLLYPVAPRLAFTLGGLVTLAAAVLAWRTLPLEGGPIEVGTSSAGLVLRHNLLSLGTAWAQGFLEGGTLTFLSIYLLGLGHSQAVVSGMMGGLFLGVVLIQIPVACLADRLGRLQVLLSCHLLLLGGLACLPFCTPVPVLSGWLFVVGAACAALYPLGLALLGERVPAPVLARANAWYLACNCAGSLSGPVLIGLAIDLCGPRAQFAAGAAAVASVVVAGLICHRSARVRLPDDSAGGRDAAPRRMAG
jgi:MFS family permease